MRRPPSLSDSFIYGGDAEKLVPLRINAPLHADLYVQPEPAELFTQPGPVVEEPTVISRGNKIAEYTLRFLFHISLIAVFETLFFFMFVSKDEDKGIMGTIDHYTDIVLDRCENMPTNETTVINYILERYVNVSSDLAAAGVAAANRSAYNTSLLQLSCFYIAGLFGLMGVVAGFSRCNGYKIRWVYIISENICLVTMLGLYEYMFFQTVVTNYTTASSTEITGMFINGLQQRCHLLT